MNRTKVRMMGVGVALASGACTTAMDLDQRPNLEGSEQAIIAGFPANSAKLNAVGALSIRTDWSYYYDDYYYDDYGEMSYDMVCTATLIAPQAVLTAKHCVDGLSWSASYGGVPVFTVGPDAMNPLRAYEIADYDTTPSSYDGWTGMGNDVAVMYLAEPVEDIVPAKVSEIPSDAEGSTFAAIGYGESTSNYDYGARRVGSVEFRAREGLIYELIFGDFPSYYQWYAGEELSEECAEYVATLSTDDSSGVVIFFNEEEGVDEEAEEGEEAEDTEVVEEEAGTSEDDDPFISYFGTCYVAEWAWYDYNAYRLEDADQVFVGGTPGDAQPCYGDSGGPLLRNSEDGLTVYGVTSGGVYSDRLQCDYGAVYAAFPADTLAMLNAAKDWVDPCEDLTVEGYCDGDVARRCTGWLEGKRRTVDLDCSLLGLTCEDQGDGAIGCGDLDSFAEPEPENLGEPRPVMPAMDAFKHSPAMEETK